jgi:hypothetical protein
MDNNKADANTTFFILISMPCKIIARIVGSETNAALSGKTLLAKIVNAENKKSTVFCPF